MYSLVSPVIQSNWFAFVHTVIGKHDAHDIFVSSVKNLYLSLSVLLKVSQVKQNKTFTVYTTYFDNILSIKTPY